MRPGLKMLVQKAQAELAGVVVTSCNPLEDHERVLIFRLKKNLIRQQVWKARDREYHSHE